MFLPETLHGETPEMKTALLALLCLCTSCIPDLYTLKVPKLIKGLEDVHQWNQVRGAHRSADFIELMKLGSDAIDALAEGILDERLTKLMGMYPDFVPPVGDICFLILCRITGRSPDEFTDDGVLFAEGINPAYALKFGPGARRRVRDRFLR